MKRAVIILAAFLLVSGIGCSKTSKSGSGSGSGFSDQDLALSQSERFGEGNIPQAQGDTSLVKDVHFDFDSSVISVPDREIVLANATAILKDPSLYVEVEGHCDKRGTSEYNLALGERRARAAASMLVSFGVPATRVSTISYGAEIPLDQGNTEESYARNRRAHFALYRKDGSR